MKKLKYYFNNPYLWSTVTVLAASLIVVGWARSYPVNLSPVEMPIFSAVSPLLWIGLCFGFLGLAGLVLTSSSKYVHWLSSCLFVLLLTAPQFLYLSWGSDAGALSDFVNYIHSRGQFNLQNDILASSYFQWPLSIFFAQFLMNAFLVDVSTAIHIAYFFITICVSSGLFALWFAPMSKEPSSSRAVFWGIVVYFAGFYWLFNWQAVPYTFSLALFIPALALLDKQTWQHKLLLFLLFGVGIESHALFGVWTILIEALLLAIAYATRARKRDMTLLTLTIVIQVSVLIYKNVWFLKYIIFSIQGYYQAMLAIDSTDKALAIQMGKALSPLPSDLIGSILKIVSWLELGIIGVVFAIATANIILSRNLKSREMALLAVGFIYFMIGTQYAAIGTRALQIIAMSLSFFVVQSIARSGKVGRVTLIGSIIGLLLFPAPIMRIHQTSQSYLKPSDISIQDFLVEHNEKYPENLTILNEGRIRAIHYFPHTYAIHNPRTISLSGCNGYFIVKDSEVFRNYVEIAAWERGTEQDIHILLNNLSFDFSTIYDDGTVTLRIGKNCKDLSSLWE